MKKKSKNKVNLASETDSNILQHDNQNSRFISNEDNNIPFKVEIDKNGNPKVELIVSNNKKEHLEKWATGISVFRQSLVSGLKELGAKGPGFTIINVNTGVLDFALGYSSQYNHQKERFPDRSLTRHCVY